MNNSVNKTILGFNVKIHPDKIMFPGKWIPPIKWSGKIGNLKVEFMQIEASGSRLECFDFSGFPYDKQFLEELRKEIDDVMRVMD